MQLERPIVFFDVETTGLELAHDRIIEIQMIKMYPNGEQIGYYTRLNPEGREIAPGAYEKHKIKTEDLIDCPTFKQVSQTIYNFIKDCDLGGYNCKRFDIPMLIEEFLRAGVAISVKEFKVVDVYKILMKAEPRTLSATYKRFFGKELEQAHSAESDIKATIEILDALKKQFEIPDNAEELDKFAFEDDGNVDLENKLKKKDDKIYFNFGKYKEKTIQEVYQIDPGYYDWIINYSDMTMYTKAIFRNIVKFLTK